MRWKVISSYPRQAEMVELMEVIATLLVTAQSRKEYAKTEPSEHTALVQCSNAAPRTGDLSE